MFENSKVTSEVEAYILGFICADGTIVGHNGILDTLNITASIKDKEHIQSINKFLNGKIGFYNSVLNGKEFPIIRLSLYSRKKVKNLNNLGIIQNKTYYSGSKVFDNVKYKSDFLRGYFDGNGCVSINKKGQINVEMCSRNIPLLNSFLDFIKKNVKTKANVTIGDGVYRIRFGGNKSSKKIYELFYSNNPILYLNRKRSIFKW